MGETGVAERKRARSEPDLDSPESDLTRADSFSSAEPDLDPPETKRLRADSDLDSPDVRRIKDDLLNILDDSDGVADRDPAIQDLDSVIKSFEEEILVPPAAVDHAPHSAEAQTELGYLLEASDDELGLPPSFGSSEDDLKSEDAAPPEKSAGAFAFNDSSGFENDLPNYDSFEFGMCGGPDFGSQNHVNDNHYVALGGLFDYADDRFDGSDEPEYLWRPESLPAI